MIPAPKTVSLNPSEWKALLVANAADMHAGFTSLACPDPDQLQAIDQHLDRMKALALAWHRSAPAIATQVEPPMGKLNVPQELEFEVDAVKPKGKPGWPKGRKRGPRKQKAA